MSKKKKLDNRSPNQGYLAQSEEMTLRTWTVGALPLINRILDRMRLDSFFEEHLPTDGPTMKVPTRRGLLLLVRNILLSREPIYGLGEWAGRHAPDLIGIPKHQLKHLNDDRIGRCLDRLFEGMDKSLIISVVRHVIREFDLRLDELHNDSTTVTFQGAYTGAYQEGFRRGIPTLGIKWGHNKDHRPDLKQLLYILTVTDDNGNVLDRLSVAGQRECTSDGYRLLWFFSQRKAVQDAQTRANQIEKILQKLNKLQERLESPKTRFRNRPKVEEAVVKILAGSPVGHLIDVQIQEHEIEKFTQATPGRPGPNTQYSKKIQIRYRLSMDLHHDQCNNEVATDGTFPLITNAENLSAEEVLRAYKRQPLIEKRFSQFKNDFEVAPVFLKEVSRIQALLGVYFFVLIVQTLLERELRNAMEEELIEDLPLYPEGRACKAPTTRRVLDFFESIQRHQIDRDGLPYVFLLSACAI